MDNDKDSETSEIEVLPDELASVKQMMVKQNDIMEQISKSLREIQESLSGKNNSTDDQKNAREENPSNNNKCWDVEEVEGTLEFGNDGLVTAKGSYGLVRAVNYFPLKEHGIIFFELKIADIPNGCALQIGISQKTMAMSSFYVFEPAFELKNENEDNVHKGHVIGCGVKLCAGKLFITKNGKAEKTVELAELKCGDGVDQKLTIKLVGEGCVVHLGRIAMSDDESKCSF